MVQTGKPNRIAILLGAPFTAQNYERVGIPYLSKHFEVIVFDCMRWLGRDGNAVDSERVQYEKLVSVCSEAELDAAIKNYRPTHCIDWIGMAVGNGFYTYMSQHILRGNNVCFIVPQFGNLPVDSFWTRLNRYVFRLFDNELKPLKSNEISLKNDNSSSNSLYCKYTLVNRISAKINSLFERRRYIFTADVRLFDGDKSLNSFTNSSNKIIWVGSQDYYTHTNCVNEDTVVNKGNPFVVFMDDYLPFASDWKLLGVKPPVSADCYYDLMRSIFDKIESECNMPVIVAGHPSSRGDFNMSSNFGGRIVLFDKSAILAHRSAFVLAHGSTAVSFAVLSRKPILLLTTLELNKAAYSAHIRTLGRCLGSPILLIDNFGGKICVPDIDVKKYQRYEENYLRSRLSKEKEPWEEMVNFIKD